MKTKTAVLLVVAAALVACKEQESEVPKAVAVPEEPAPLTPVPPPVNPAPLVVPGEDPSVVEVEVPGAAVIGEELQEEGPTAGERLDHAIDSTGRGLKTAGEKTVEGVGIAAEKTGEALQTAGEKTEEGVKKGVQATGRFFKRVGEKLEGAGEAEAPESDE